MAVEHGSRPACCKQGNRNNHDQQAAQNLQVRGPRHSKHFHPSEMNLSDRNPNGLLRQSLLATRGVTSGALLTQAGVLRTRESMTEAFFRDGNKPIFTIA